MANYVVDPKILKPYLPYGTELDFWNKQTYLSLVGFMFLHTRVLGIPIPFHQNFEEVNLRFYVRYKHENEWRRGVVFIKEIVPKWAISFVANNLYGEHYISLPMRNDLIHEKDNILGVKYAWKYEKQWNHLSVQTTKKLEDIEEGSEAEFITEHYWGYTKLKEKTTSQYQVEHPKWKINKVLNWDININSEALYGEKIMKVLNTTPSSVFMAKGSEILVRKAALIQEKLGKIDK